VVTKGVVAGALCALAIACSASKPRLAASPTTMPSGADGGAGLAPDGMAPLDEIRQLDQEIEAALTGVGLRPAGPPPCAANQSCGQVAPIPMGLAPAVEDPTCKAGASETCKDSCTLSDSICKNADRICVLATELGGSVAYANETCEKGNASCKASRERCCGCM
jgi:hypothetical protein